MVRERPRVQSSLAAPSKPHENQHLDEPATNPRDRVNAEQNTKKPVKTARNSEKTVKCCSRAVRRLSGQGSDPQPLQKKTRARGDATGAHSQGDASEASKGKDSRPAAALQTARFLPLNKRQRGWIEPPKRFRSRRARCHQEPKKPWVRLFLEVLEHDAYRGLSINARRAYDALVCHLHRSGSIENGSLDVSHKTFESLGVTHRYVASALRELEEAGLIWSSRAEQKHPLLPAAKRYGVTAYAYETKRAFAWVHLDFLESKSYRGLSINARRVLERLLIENTRHRYKENGNLRVSSRQFAGSLNGRRHIAKAIHELQESGLLDITKGKPNGRFAAPNLYRLKFLGTIDGPSTWRQREGDAIPEKTIPTTQKWSTPATRKWSTHTEAAAAAPSGEPTQKQTKNLTKGGPIYNILARDRAA